MVALPEGRLLLTGSEWLPRTDDAPSHIAPWSMTYDPLTETTVEHDAPRAIFPRGVVLSDGRVVVAGGFADPPLADGTRSVPWVEIFE